MKATIHRPDGTRIELDGTPAEIREAIGVHFTLSPTVSPYPWWWYPIAPVYAPTCSTVELPLTAGSIYTSTNVAIHDDVVTGAASYTVTPS